MDIRFETEYGETKVEKTPPLYLSKTKQEIIAKIKPLTEKEKEDLIDYIDYIEFLKTKRGVYEENK